jgi:cytochrome P450
MTETADESLVFDPFAAGFAEDPYPHYAELRAATAIQQHPLGFWLLTRHADVAELLRSGLSVEARNLAPSPLRELRQSYGADRASGAVSMLDRDPPDHTRLRKLVAKVFTPRSIAALEPGITELVDASLDRLARQRRADLVAELAFPLPFTVISRMLGMPPTDHARLRELTGTLVRSLEPVIDPDVLRAIDAADEELIARTWQAIEWKRANPADDLLTALISAEADGDVLSDDELVAQVILLYVAGHETTVNLLANGVLALLRHPDQLTALRERPELAANAVEEFLRYDSPVQLTRRITTEPFTIAGQRLQAGSFVIASIASANRDERCFGDDAGTLRLDRGNARQHVSFGAGVHHCLGAALARLEGRVAIERLVRRFDGLELDGDIGYNGRINLRGPVRVPVRV